MVRLCLSSRRMLVFFFFVLLLAHLYFVSGLAVLVTFTGHVLSFHSSVNPF